MVTEVNDCMYIYKEYTGLLLLLEDIKEGIREEGVLTRGLKG